MKKETINTFEGGMIKDLHPLTTPKNVLTDALNATFVTYNGNESILQNDMGNVEIKHALLKAGYIPVGMKEHGGIVYVAAYNPKTGKGQVGSFPSPKQIWEGENWTVNSPASIITSPTLNTDFYHESGNFIINETIKQEIFSTSQGARIFHPGDKFVIGLNSDMYDSLQYDIENDYMDIQLGVVKSDGSIEIMRVWSVDSPDNIFYNGDATAEGILQNKEVVKVFDASSSGQLILIMNLHTLDSFSINKKYSSLGKDNNDNEIIQVTFEGEAYKNGEVINSNNTGLKLCKGSTDGSEPSDINIDLSSITVQGSTGNQSFMIYPNVPFGIIKRMGRRINVDFDKIKNSQDDFNEWRFFVTDKYIKIGWAYDFYNLDESKELEYIKMYFHKLQDGYDRSKAKSIEFQKEYYSGNFEDYINYSDIDIVYKNIYIVEVVKKFTDSQDEQIICFKMLYLSPLYNSKYNGFYNNQSAQETDDIEFTKIASTSTDLDLESSININLVNSKVRVKKPGQEELGNEIDINDIESSQYVMETTNSQLSEIQDDDKLFTSQVINTYDGAVSIKGSIKHPGSDYIGRPSNTLLEEILENCTIESVSLEYKDGTKVWVQESSKVFPDPGNIDQSVSDNISYEKSDTINDNTITISIDEFSDSRVIQGFSSNLQSTTFTTRGLKPLLAASYSKDRKDRVAPYWDQEAVLCMAGEGDHDDTIWYNSTLTSTGEVIKGPDAGGGCDDGGLRTAATLMGKPMTNIFVGSYMGEDAEICFDRLKKNTQSEITGGQINFVSGEGENLGNFLDYQGGNWMVACWKSVDGEAILVNLETPKTLPVKSNVVWPRLDVMLRSILSQIFLVNNVNKTMNYVTTDPRFYRYQDGTLILKLQLLYNTEQIQSSISDILVDDSDKSLNQYLTEKWGLHNISNTTNQGITVTIDNQDKEFKFTNLIPEVSLNIPSSEIPIELEIPNYYVLDKLLEYYQGVVYSRSNESGGFDIKSIYSIDVNQAAYNKDVCAKNDGDYPTPNIDGTYEWLETPKCVEVTNDLVIHRWHPIGNSHNILFKNFKTYFTTRAEQQEWLDLPEGEENEVLAKTQYSTQGKWTNSVDNAAPDMYYKNLYSETVSALKDTLTYI